uniref:Uncharacterized protein n=1 Tax=Neobodo designis TaxID=312471 RepID=A0A7S1QU03_NEODS
MASGSFWLIFSLGCACLLLAFWSALSLSPQLQAVHHARSTAASALSAFPMLQLEAVTSGGVGTGHVLPLFTMVAALAGGALAIIGGIGVLFKLHPIKRVEYAPKCSYDAEVFAGYDFAHFNHRGRAAPQ